MNNRYTAVNTDIRMNTIISYTCALPYTREAGARRVGKPCRRGVTYAGRFCGVGPPGASAYIPPRRARAPAPGGSRRRVRPGTQCRAVQTSAPPVSNGYMSMFSRR